MRVNRKTLTITIGLLAVLVMGGGILRAAVWGPDADTFSVCVDQHGNIRLLGDQLAGNLNTTCKSNEVLYEFASGQRVDLLSGEVQVLQTQIADVQAILSATPTPPTPTPTSTSTPIPGLPTAYQAVLSILGPTGVILPLVADTSTNGFAATFTTVGAQAATFTWSEPPTTFDTPPGTQGSVPVVTFNGSDEEADSPDANYWSRDDSSGEAWSVGLWINTTGGAAQTIFAKYDTAEAIQEWAVQITSDDILGLDVRDDNVNVDVTRDSDAAITTNAWVFLVLTYDGAGGATAMNTVTLYADGSSIASTASNNASYVAMENGTSTVDLYHLSE